MLSTFLDVTELKRAEERLRESEERYRLLIEHLPDKIVVVSEEVFSFINKEGATLMGAQKPQEIIGRNVFDFVPNDYQDYIKSIVDKVTKDKVVIGPSQYKTLTLDNKVIDIETIFIPITYEGKLTLLGVSRDITERKKRRKL